MGEAKGALKSQASPLPEPADGRRVGAHISPGSQVPAGGHPGSCARLLFMRQPSRRNQIFAALFAALTMLLLVVPAAFAENGVGLAGPTTDKTVTFFCFGVIGFFAVLVIVMSLIQGRLEKRKEMRKQTLSRLN